MKVDANMAGIIKTLEGQLNCVCLVDEDAITWEYGEGALNKDWE